MLTSIARYILLIFVIYLQSSFAAADSKSAQQNQKLTIAMLDSVSPKKATKPLLVSNCMKWSAAQLKQKSKPFDKLILKFSRRYKVDGNLIRSVIAAESCFKTNALSHAGAQGLMQLIPATAARFGVKNSYLAEQNIQGGVKYLRFLLDRYQGDFKKVIAAYNAGEGRVDRYKGIPPFKETKQYVKNVLKTYALLSPKRSKKSVTNKKKRVKAVYYPPSLGKKPGRHGWRYNRRLAPHLYK